ncbi:hydroperoxidase II [compost metagenome]
MLTAASVLYDAVYLPGGTNSVATLEAEANAIHFLNEAFKHCKAIAADEQALQVLEATYFYKKLPAEYTKETVLREGVVVSGDIAKLIDLFKEMIALHRFWDRENPRKIPA